MQKQFLKDFVLSQNIIFIMQHLQNSWKGSREQYFSSFQV